MNRIHRQSQAILSWTLSIFLLMPGFINKDELNSDADVLAYAITNYQGGSTISVYDPYADEHTIIYESDDLLHRLRYSSVGRIAFSSWHEDKATIYVLDSQTTPISLTNLSQELNLSGYPLGWSPDGHYLAFVSFESDDSLSIRLWDGKIATNITPDDMNDTPQSYDVAWSPDGRLAFTVWFGFSNDSTVPEIYLWDGNSTANLSQNSGGDDRSPIWSADSQIAFLSAQNNTYDILVWDGVSINNGLPDRTTFTNIAPELTNYYSHPTWTNEGLLAFGAQGEQDDHIQVYVWDGQSASNLSQNPDSHNGRAAWSVDGKWAFVTYFSQEELLYIRDANNRNLFITEGQYGPVWNSSGFLAFCTRSKSLFVWDGHKIIPVTEGSEVWAQWKSGSYVHCTSG